MNALVAVMLLAGVSMLVAPKSFFTQTPASAPVDAKSGAAPGSGQSPTSGPGVASSLLPKTQRGGVEDFDPNRLLQGQSFIHGVPGSVTSSLRNANLQLRSDPPIDRKPVSIFNQSTIAADTMRPNVQIGRAQSKI